MTAPRQILPESTYFLTRRCARRELRLVPSSDVNRIVGYCIAEAACYCNVAIHGVTVMSNHLHQVVTDRDGRLPEFIARVHRHIAICMNAKFKWTENFWSPAKTSIVRLEDASAVLRKLTYLQLNPVAARLVKCATDWPGFHTARTAFGETQRFERPRWFFRGGGALPEIVDLELVRPEAFAEMSDEECTLLLGEAVGEEQSRIRERVSAEGLKFLGAWRCMKLSRLSKPAPEESAGRLSPSFATTDRDLRRAALERRRCFLSEYRFAYRRWKAGDRDVEFPPGTYWLRAHAGVRCRAPT